MILYLEPALKVLITLSVLISNYLIFRKRSSRFQCVLICALLLFCAVLAHVVSNCVPPLTDQVTLTALGEKRAESSAAEVVLSGFTIDEKHYSAGESLKIESGHWFWRGDAYCWRIETDLRQPDGMTRGIEASIPVGVDRTLDFQSDIWSGFVEITSVQGTQIFDTYSEGGIVSASIGSSQTHMLMLDQLYHIALFALILLGSAAVIGQSFWYLARYPDKARNWSDQHSGKLLYGGMAVFVFVLMFHYADSSSLWNDELYHISVGTDISLAIQNCLNMVDISPPLYGICAAIWYSIAPYGEQWLLLLSIVPVVISIYVMGLIGERLKGKNCGVLAAALLAFSTTVWGYVAFDFRPYAFTLFFCTLSLYCHVQRNTMERDFIWRISYSVALTGLAMSHYFGMLACGLFFLCDLILVCRKKKIWKILLSYLLPGAISIIWLSMIYVTVLQHKDTGAIASWYAIPTFSSVAELFNFLTGNFNISFWLAVLGVASGIVCLWNLFVKREKWKWDKFYQAFSVGVITITITVLVLYGNFINTTSTMWQERYFIYLIPFVSILSALAITSFFRTSNEDGAKGTEREKIFGIFLSLLVAANCIVAAPTCGVTYQPFRQAADWLYTQANTIFNQDTVIITTINFEKGWSNYYIEREGRRDALNVINQYICSPEALLQYNRIYLQYSHIAVSEWLQAYLDENYTLELDDTSVQIRSYVRK